MNAQRQIPVNFASMNPMFAKSPTNSDASVTTKPVTRVQELIYKFEHKLIQKQN